MVQAPLTPTPGVLPNPSSSQAMQTPQTLLGLLFDLDGTLVHTDPLHFQAWQEGLAPYDFVVDDAFYRTQISGKLNPDIVRHLLPYLPPNKQIELFETKEVRFRELAETLQPTAGLSKLLHWSKAKNLKQALVTNAPPKNVKHMLQVLSLDNTFEAVVIGDLLERGKPDPLPYETALQKLNLQPQFTLAFEDSPTGVRSAVGAGIPTIGIVPSHQALHTSESLIAAGAFLIISDFNDEKLWDFLSLI